jgi:hypothetical protein
MVCMKHLTPIFVLLVSIGPTAAAQPLDRPPVLKDAAPRIEAKDADPAAAAPLTEPDDAHLLPPKSEVQREVRFEQRRQGARVSEIVVTPAGRTYSYTIQNREGQRPLFIQDLASGLSTPRFLKFEF